MLYNDRIPLIFNILTESDEYITSNNISDILNISTRTIKEDMKSLSEYCTQFGSSLVSKRGKGYRLEINNFEKFSKHKFINEIQSYFFINNIEFLKSKDLISLMQYIISNENRFFSLEELSELLFMSESSIKNNLDKATEIFQIFDINKNINSDGHFKFTGDEINIRICMLRLYGIFFDKFNIKSNIPDFSLYTNTEINTIKFIRKVIVKNIIKYKLSIWDDNVQFLTRYISLAIERGKRGKRLETNKRYETILPNFVAAKMLSESIVYELNNIYTFSNKEREIIQIFIILFTEEYTIDPINDENQNLFNLAREITSQCLYEFQFYILEKNKINRAYEEKLYNAILHILIKNIIKIEFVDVDINSYKIIQNHKLKNISPLSLIFSKLILNTISINTQYIISKYDEYYLINKINLVLQLLSFESSKLNIAISGKDILTTSYIRNKLLELSNSNLINNIDDFPLYRGRYEFNNDYDLYIVDNSMKIYYQYSWNMIAINPYSITDFTNLLLPNLNYLSYKIHYKYNNFFEIHNFCFNNKNNIFDYKNIDKYINMGDYFYLKLIKSNENKVILTSVNKALVVEIYTLIKTEEELKILNTFIDFIYKYSDEILSINTLESLSQLFFKYIII